MNWLKSLWNAFTVPAAGRSGSPESQPNFTQDAQQVLALARKEATRLKHNFVGTEHLLLGLIRLGAGPAVTVLRAFGLDLENVRSEVEQFVGVGPDREWSGNTPYTPRVKKVLALAAIEARNLRHSSVGTEHLLLGLLVEGDGVASRVLKKLGVDTERTRQEILQQVDPSTPGSAKDLTSAVAPRPAAGLRPQAGSVDTNKRYDVYCRDGGEQVVVYRNALFKGRSKLLSARDHDLATEFLELEQSNGQTVYLSVFSVFRFCEHGAEIVGETIPRQ